MRLNECVGNENIIIITDLVRENKLLELKCNNRLHYIGEDKEKYAPLTKAIKDYNPNISYAERDYNTKDIIVWIYTESNKDSYRNLLIKYQ